MQRVLVIDRNRQPLMPCHPARARALLKAGKAAVFRRFPFTLILKDREGGAVQDTRLKLDPGSKATGIAVVAGFVRRGATLIWAAELAHRGAAIRKALADRRAHRRFRRSKLRYRPARFDNRTRPVGWLAPSLQHRVDTTMTWVSRLMRWAPVSALSQELVKFDTQALQNPEISGVEYQQGTLAGYEVREYLLEKWRRTCAYCDAQSVPLQVEHIVPKARGGSNRISNLTLSCAVCNTTKGTQTIEAFLAHDPQRLARIQAQAKAPLRDAAAVNSTRWTLFNALMATGLPVETGTGGRTQFNRSRQSYPKAHWIDAACVGESGASVRLDTQTPVLQIQATGHGNRRMRHVNAYGFPVGKPKSRRKTHFGFQTGDMVKAVVTSGKKAGVYLGRVACRRTGSFKIVTASGKVDGIHHRFCKLICRQDGYTYAA